MKRKIVGVGLLVSLLLGTPALASGTPAQFGENPQRTHENGINDPIPWKKIVNISNFDFNGQSISMTGNGSPIAQDKTLIAPVTAPNSDPDQVGYLVSYDMGNWVNGAPSQNWSKSLLGVSNSTPIISNGNTYVAAGNTLFGFDKSGQRINYSIGNIGSSSPVYRNQVVSHPLYVMAAQQGTSADSIWVSSQNGWLFAINPTDLSQQFFINIGSRLDGSPSLVRDTTGTSYIAVGTAYSPNNTGGTGALYIVDPRTGQIVSSLPNPMGNNSPIVTAPISTGQGYLMWNDYAGDVFFYRLNPGGTLTEIYKWPAVGGAGKTTNQEAGFSSTTGYYLLPFSSDRFTMAINANNPTQQPQKFEYLDASGSVSSPVLSQKYLYVADNTGAINQIPNVASTFQNGGMITVNWATGPAALNLTNPTEAILGTPYGTQEPTLALVTTEGLQIWQTLGANYDFGSNFQGTYVNGQQISFTQPLKLTLKENNLNTVLFSNDQLDISYRVDGGAYQPLTSVNVYQNGSPQTEIVIPTSVMAQAAQTWTDSQTHKITFQVSEKPGNQAAYRFNSLDSGTGQGAATVTYTFSEQNQYKVAPVTPLTMKFGDFTQPVRQMSDFTVPVIISNSSNQDVTATVNFQLKGMYPQPYQETYTDANGDTYTVTRYHNVPITETVTKTITVKANGVYTWTIGNNDMQYTLAPPGGPANGATNAPLNVGAIYDNNGIPTNDPTYTAQLTVTGTPSSSFVQPVITQTVITAPIGNPQPERPRLLQ